MIGWMSLDHHLQENLVSTRWCRLFAARLDMTIKRAQLNTKRVASFVGTGAANVVAWRAGIALPSGKQCQKLAQMLNVDVNWLCALP